MFQPHIKCGCRVERVDVQRGPSFYHIHYCPTHQAAPKILVELQRLVGMIERDEKIRMRHLTKSRQLIEEITT